MPSDSVRCALIRLVDRLLLHFHLLFCFSFSFSFFPFLAWCRPRAGIYHTRHTLLLPFAKCATKLVTLRLRRDVTRDQVTSGLTRNILIIDERFIGDLEEIANTCEGEGNETKRTKNTHHLGNTFYSTINGLCIDRCHVRCHCADHSIC